MSTKPLWQIGKTMPEILAEAPKELARRGIDLSSTVVDFSPPCFGEANMNDVCERLHESVEVARLDAAKFIINHFDTNVKDAEKPGVYKAAIAHIEKALKSDD
jgi:hypothetical protein